MEAKDVKTLMEAYASVYEGYGKKKKGDCVSKSEKGAHNCAKKVCHEQYGEGETIFGQHAVPDENGFVSHYDVQFGHGIVEDVSVDELEIITEGSHNEENHWYEGETISEEDVFDIIKGHLIGEGFAETEEAALAIMANMSEGWRQSIVEDEQSSADARERNRRTQDILDKRRNAPSDVVPPAPKLPPAPPESSGSKPRDRSAGSSPAPRDRSTGNIPPRTGGGSVKSIPPRRTGGGQVTGNIGSPGTIGTIQGGKPGDGYLGPTIRIGKTTIGIPNPNPVRRSGN